MRFFIFCILVLAAIAFIGIDFREQKYNFPNTSIYYVEKSKIETYIKIRGSLVAEKSELIYPSVTSRLIYLIPEGRTAKKETIIARLDGIDLEREIKNIQKKIKEKKSLLVEYQSNLTIKKEQKDGKIENAETNWNIAELENNKYCLGESIITTRKNTSAIEIAQIKWNRVQKKWDAMAELLEKGFITHSRVTEEKFKLYQVRTEKEDSVHKANIYEKYIKVIDIQRFKNKEKNMLGEYETISNKLQKEIEKEQGVILQEKTELQKMIQEEKKKQEKIDKLEIKAPFDCLIIYGDVKQPWSRRWIKLGEYVWEDMAIFTLPNLSQMKIEALVKEEYLRFLKKDMEVNIDIAAANIKKAQGKISKIHEIATKNDWSIDSGKKFKIEITFSSQHPDFTLGTTAKIELPVLKTDNVLKVPAHAIIKEQQEYFIYLWQGENIEPKKQLITLGEKGLYYVEVVSGLSEGDPVFIGKLP